MNATAVVTSGGLNMRAEPRMKADRVAVLGQGASVTVIGTAPRGWLRVRAGGKVGYVHGDFVKLVPPVPDVPPVPAPAEMPASDAEPPFNWPAVAICAAAVAAAIVALFLV